MGFAVAGVGALVVTTVVADQARTLPYPAVPSAATLTAAAQPLPLLLTQPTSQAPVGQLAAAQPLNPLVQQVGFHVALVIDFVSTGAVLFAREFAIPGALLQDIHNGTPVPAAVSQALQTFAQIELEAGSDLVSFAVEYVSFQLNFVVNLATMPVAALAGMAPASATQASVASGGAAAVPHVLTTATTSDEVTTTVRSRVGDPRPATSAHADTGVEQPKKLRLTVAEPASDTSTTAKTDDADVDAVASHRAGVDAPAAATHAPSGVTHKRAERDGHPKRGGGEGD
jgi:hypothetical protein